MDKFMAQLTGYTEQLFGVSHKEIKFLSVEYTAEYLYILFELC
jgi:hypothetical protein